MLSGTTACASSSRFIAFLDECGDHSLDSINPEFPLFVLSTVVVERRHYAEDVIPALGRLKLRYWPHEGVNLHTRHIRKQLDDFQFLMVPVLRQQFLEEMSATMRALRFHLFITAIRKPEYKARYGSDAGNPYEAALALTFERVLHLLEAEQETTLPLVAEARGRAEDAQLAAAFGLLLANGTTAVPPQRFRSLQCPLTFVNKERNVAGTQLADLCGYPASRHILKPSQPNHAFDIVRPRLYQSGSVSGWRIFPE